MWPSTPASMRLSSIPCPAGPECDFDHCIFAHDVTLFQPARPSDASSPASLGLERAPERLQVQNDIPLPFQQASQLPASTPEPHVFVGSLTSARAPAFSKQDHVGVLPKGTTTTNNTTSNALPRTATRPVSPPPKKAGVSAPRPPEFEVQLTPRKLTKEPAQFTRRLAMLRLLHQHMSALNDKIPRAVNPEIRALHLSLNQLKKLVVDEEERIAKENGPVYENVLGHRLVALKKMTIQEWVKSRREALRQESGHVPTKSPFKKFDTGLTPEEEVMLLSTLTAPEESLILHGFVTKQATATELEETRATQAVSDFWEVCERCNTRFQVFPDRREEDGALTASSVRCRYHWGRKLYPKKAKGQLSGSPTMSCCNQAVGSYGCTTNDSHVYKLSDVKRMSLSMNYIETPENDKVAPNTAVCFDCEMGYTTAGMELIRLTVVAWPTHKPLVDVLVRPLGHVLDLNTRFSGVTPEQFLSANEFDPNKPRPIRHDLRIVDSTYIARDLFLAHVSPKTPVLGHALENDLNVIRLIHPTIVDSTILYPAPRGLPYRNGLKNLAKWHLNLDVQQGGAAGHDSYEDAKTAGELIRVKVKDQWKQLKEQGWVFRGDGVHPPLPDGLPPPMIGALEDENILSASAEKRKRGLVEDSDTGDDLPAKKQA